MLALKTPVSWLFHLGRRLPLLVAVGLVDTHHSLQRRCRDFAGPGTSGILQVLAQVSEHVYIHIWPDVAEQARKRRGRIIQQTHDEAPQVMLARRHTTSPVRQTADKLHLLQAGGFLRVDSRRGQIDEQLKQSKGPRQFDLNRPMSVLFGQRLHLHFFALMLGTSTVHHRPELDSSSDCSAAPPVVFIDNTSQ